MITLQDDLAQGLGDVGELRKALQSAIELEHSTIPTYLYALYSLEPGHNTEIAGLVASVVIEEMTHFGLACNILNAIGGEPAIDTPQFVPSYPGPLPGAVESGLIVPLSPFTQDLVENVFMVIEEPEDPLVFPAGLEASAPLTIGQFYQAISVQIQTAGPSIFTGDPARQVDGVLEVTAVTDVAGAVAAIELIVEQGEGTTQSPVDEQGELAHYYRFAEIHHGRQLVPVPDPPPDATPEERYAYTGPPIPFDENWVRPLVLNPKLANYPAGSAARTACANFNYAYTSLLKTLHATFNGEPAQIGAAIGLMESLKQQALDMGTLAVGDLRAGPSFEYQPTNP